MNSKPRSELGISATEPDWSREELHIWWDPAKQLIHSIRRFHQVTQRKGLLNKLLAKYYVFKHRFWSAVAGADIPINCNFAGGLRLTHPIGIVIHPNCEIGPNCMILQNTTIVEGVKVGGHVDISAGAKIVKAVTIGDHAVIGANAVVLQDVPAGATAVGIPARIIPAKESD